MQQNRGRRKERVGIVLSDKMDKTITIRAERLTRHPWIGKAVKKYSKFTAHDEKNEAKTGDKVKIISTRPLSKTKRWRLIKIFK